MFSRPKNWISGGLWKPKNPHSLEHLKYLYNVLCKNQVVTEQNKGLLVETLRSISEILIWGDQNDSTVFDFFLEKNMLSFFLRFMRQKSGRYICVQLLQTLNILFENISNETSVYYLLSNNHINSIIVHKFDFSDEEVMAYYISFLKTLSLKLNKHTIHFFYNEHTNDFALYTEGIKFFNHSESMVRIAVRTITLNVYKGVLDISGQRKVAKVDDKSMLRYIRDRTAAPYFSNLVWFIGNHIIDLDSCVRNDADHNSRDRLADLVAEHLDHLHYLNDILSLQIDALNEVLTDHLLNRLLIPLYVYSLTKRRKYTARTKHRYGARALGRKDDRPHVSSVVSLFLLSQVFLIISHAPLVRQLADIIFNGDMSVCLDTPDTSSPQTGRKIKLRGFVKPKESLAQTLDNVRGTQKSSKKRPNFRNSEEKEERKSSVEGPPSEGTPEVVVNETEEPTAGPSSSLYGAVQPNQNSTDEEKLILGGTKVEQIQAKFTLNNRPYLEAVFNALECSENDYEALFALCLLYALGHNQGINQELLDSVFMPTENSPTKDHYNVLLVEKLIKMISLSCQTGSRVRLATLEMGLLLLNQLVYGGTTCHLQDRHLAALEGAREEGTLLLRNFYKSEEIFLDMFEDEYREMKSRPLNVEYLMMDASILLPPTGTPLTGIDFNKRLPCGEVERARRAIRVFFMLRDLSLSLRQEQESQLPLTKQEECVKVNDVLDLNNSDLIACTVITRDNRKERRFLVIDVLQLILVEPDSRRLGWGVVKFVGFLQDVEVTGDKDDSRSLHITIHKPSLNVHARPLPLLSARFLFDDHIRCMAAKQRLTKGRLRARQRKMQMIARLLELPSHIVDSMYQPAPYAQSAAALRAAQNQAGASIPGRSHPGRAQRGGVARAQTVESSQPSAFSPITASPVSSHERISKRQASLPIPIKHATPTHSLPSPEIEEAEEAVPSPDVHARQSLNSSRSGRDTSVGSNGGPQNGVSSKQQDIPLEDLSQRAKAAISHARDFLNKSEASAKARSSSYSPHRLRNSSPVPSPRGRSSLLSRRLSEERSRSTGRLEIRKRAGSFPNQAGKDSKTDLTSFTVEKTKPLSSSDTSGAQPTSTQEGKVRSVSDPPAPSAGRPSKKDLKPRKRTKSGPKTLTPAIAPTASLLSAEAAPVVAVDTPILVPPARPEHIRSISDTSSVDSEQTQSDTLSGNDVPLPFPEMKRSLLADIAFADDSMDESMDESKLESKLKKPSKDPVYEPPQVMPADLSTGTSSSETAVVEKEAEVEVGTHKEEDDSSKSETPVCPADEDPAAVPVEASSQADSEAVEQTADTTTMSEAPGDTTAADSTEQSDTTSETCPETCTESNEPDVIEHTLPHTDSAPESKENEKCSDNTVETESDPNNSLEHPNCDKVVENSEDVPEIDSEEVFLESSTQENTDSDAITRPPFLITTRSRPSISENDTCADPGLVEMTGIGDETATDQLTRLAQTPPKAYTVLTDGNSLPMSESSTQQSQESNEDE